MEQLDLTQQKILSKEDVAVLVVNRSKENGNSLITTLEEIIDEYGIDVDDIKSFISEPLMAKLEAEAQTLNLLKTKNKTKCLF